MYPTLDHGLMVAREWGSEIKARIFQKDVLTGIWESVAVIDGSDIGATEDFIRVALDSGRALFASYTTSNDREGEAYFYEIAPALNAGHMGAWFNPLTSGQGQLLDIETGSQFMFTAWFTFTHKDSSNPLEQHWYTAQGTFAGNKAELLLYETLGGRFDDPQPAVTNPVGEISISFTDCSGGFMTYTIETRDLTGSFPMMRVIPGSENTCELREVSRVQAVDINPGMNGGWFDSSTGGQGFLIDAHPNPGGGNFIFVAWFTYGDNTVSGHRWLTAQGGFDGPTADLVV